jgi:phospholipid/cholesterol/gamma-HCH transport system substrate-binding protein
MTPHFARNFVIGLVYLVVIATLMTLAVLIYNQTFTSTVNVSLVTPTVGTSLEKGADVAVRGVVVGYVSSIGIDGNDAKVGIALQPAQAAHLPDNITAELLPKTLFGQRYVDLVMPARPSGRHLQNGDVIRPTGVGPTEIQDVFARLLPVLQAVRPAQLAQMLGSIAASLRGEGANFGATIQTLSGYLRKFAPKVPAMLNDIRQFSQVASNYSSAAPDLLAALRNFTVSSRTLAQQRAQFVALLQSVTSASNRFTGFLEANAPDIITLSRSSLPSLRVLARYSPEFPCLSRTLTEFIPVMNSALGKGTNQPGLHVTMQVVPPRTPYQTGVDTPHYNGSGGPRCPQVVPGTATTTTSISSGAGIGTANSPQENEVIAELEASSAHMTPAAYPKWGSLLLGPTLRGTAVTVR